MILQEKSILPPWRGRIARLIHEDILKISLTKKNPTLITVQIGKMYFVKHEQKCILFTLCFYLLHRAYKRNYQA